MSQPYYVQRVRYEDNAINNNKKGAVTWKIKILSWL